MTDESSRGSAVRRPKRWLTVEERLRLADFRAEWLGVGSCTKPADRAEAERALIRMYRAAGLEAPRIVWCGSPLSLVLTQSLVHSARALRAPLTEFRALAEKLEFPVDGAVEESVTASVKEILARGSWEDWTLTDSAGALAPVSNALRDAAGVEALHTLKESLESWVFHSVDRALDLRLPFAAIRSCISVSIANSFGALLRNQLAWSSDPDPRRGVFAALMRHAARHWRAHVAFGQHEAGWLAVADYFREACGFREQTTKALDLMLLARSAGWAFPCAAFCWVSERPTKMLLDDAGRLHCSSGPAVAYPDGWELHFWHGVEVDPEWLGLGEALDPQMVLTWPQIERRSALAEIAGGWHRLLERIPTRVVDRDSDPSIGTLLECDLPRGPVRFLRVRCGTGRTFALPVPQGCLTARQANAWTYGLEATEYALEVRT
jgi:hypothetical protein